jgi:hypothetical protein
MGSKIKVIHRKLGQERAWGLAHNSFNLIELDVKLKGRRHLLYLIHEALHIIHPEWSETKVVKVSRLMCNLLWEQNYRKVDVK